MSSWRASFVGGWALVVGVFVCLVGGGGVAVADVQVRLSNQGSREVHVWVEGSYAATVSAGSTELVTVDVALSSKKGQYVDVVCVERDGDALYVNAVWCWVSSVDVPRVVWGGIEPDPVATTREGFGLDLAVMSDWEVVSLAQRRHEGMAGSEAGRPYRFIDTRLGLVRANKRRVGARPMAAYSRTRSVFVCERGIVFVPIAAAHFAQNSTKGAVQATISRGFWIAATETTRGQYALGWGHERPLPRELELPATGMTWRMARDFCMNAAAPAGWRFDLPTEAQWDLVCTDGRQLQFNPPGVATDRIMWDSMNSGGRIRPVAGLRPTVTGVFDLHGNAGEWCRDWWAARVVGGSDPMGPSQGSERVFRGGSVANPDYLCDCSDRYGMPPGLTWPTLGFRVVLERVPE